MRIDTGRGLPHLSTHLACGPKLTFYTVLQHIHIHCQKSNVIAIPFEFPFPKPAHKPVNHFWGVACLQLRLALGQLKEEFIMGGVAHHYYF